MKQRSYNDHDDPIARAADSEDLYRYRDELFQPIWEFQSELETRWIIQDWIPEGYLVILAAGPKQGKTSLATHLALCVATGTPFAGMPTVQSSVLWLALEENGPERRLLLNQNPLAEPTTPLYTCYESLPIDKQETFDALDFWLERTQAKLIVIDPLQAASPRDLTRNWAARRSLQELKRFCHTRKVTALVLHHSKEPPRSQARVAESDQLSATASMFIVMNHRPSHQSEISNLKSSISQNSELPSEFPPHSQVMSPDINAHEGGQGGEIAHRPSPTNAPTRSELRTPNSELTHPPSPITHDPGLRPRLISLSCRGRGPFANRTITLHSTSPSDYRLADSLNLIKSTRMPIEPYKFEEILECITRCPATMTEVCARAKANPYQARNCVTQLRARGIVRMHPVGRNLRIYALSSLTASQARAIYEATAQDWEKLRVRMEVRSDKSVDNRESVGPQAQIPPELYTAFRKSVPRKTKSVTF